MAAAESEELLDALKMIAAALRDAEVPFALGGGLAAWARGGPASANDIDILLKEDDCPRALAVLDAIGLCTLVPPEGWLVKAYVGHLLVDLIHHPSGFAIDDEFLGRCDLLNVQAVRMRVMRTEDLLISKLLALTEHHLDLGPCLELARSLREQIDWQLVRSSTRQSPFARAFLHLVEEMGVLTQAAGT